VVLGMTSEVVEIGTVPVTVVEADDDVADDDVADDTEGSETSLPAPHATGVNTSALLTRAAWTSRRIA
jgi:hypothetical protein